MGALINQTALAQVNEELSKLNNKLTGLEFNLREFGEIKQNEDMTQSSCRLPLITFPINSVKE